MSGPSFITPVAKGAEIVTRVEAVLAGTIVEAPATSSAAGGSSIPGLGYMPAPGHLIMPTLVTARVTGYIFSR